MSGELEGTKATDSAEQYAIGISFGNSNSSIAHLSGVRSLLSRSSIALCADWVSLQDGKAEVIANEEGGKYHASLDWSAHNVDCGLQIV